ncbi:MAG: hypothetical protein U0Q16_27445 [Bryobacteraceae bacterium]
MPSSAIRRRVATVGVSLFVSAAAFFFALGQAVARDPSDAIVSATLILFLCSALVTAGSLHGLVERVAEDASNKFSPAAKWLGDLPAGVLVLAEIGFGFVLPVLLLILPMLLSAILR